MAAPDKKSQAGGVTSDVKKSPASESSNNERKDGLRETVESVVVAFILAFLVRTFEAEAFVIPTGSMAPTLFGRHKDVECEKCRFQFSVGASDEVDNDGILVSRIEGALCPNCRYLNDIKNLPVFKGDRILVNKFPFEFGDPRRWDVTVFKYPEEPTTNYIKRLVGLPNETILIRRGDLFRKAQAGGWEILRKDDPNKQRVLQIVVHDGDHPELALNEAGWPHRWIPAERSDASDAVGGWVEVRNGWERDAAGTSFTISADQTRDGAEHWLRYRHIAPSPDDWHYLEQGQIDRLDPRPQLVTDLCGYNSYTGGQARFDDPFRDFFWVGDLTLSCEVEVTQVGNEGELLFELNEGTRRYRCRITPGDGQATLSAVVPLKRDGTDEAVMATAPTELRGPGKYAVRFANVDARLCLWITPDPDGLLSSERLVDFGRGANYTLDATQMPGPRDADLAPVGLSVRDLGATVSHLVLERDIYYRSERYDRQPEVGGESFLKEYLSDPVTWSRYYEENMHTAEFTLGEDEYLMLGDNSPRSKDSRLWSNVRGAENRHAVERTALVGKAFFIYWPHGEPFLNDGEGYPVKYHKQWTRVRGGNHYVLEKTDYPEIRLPFYPQVDRMRRIR